MKMKRWVRVGGPLLLASLVVIVVLSKLLTRRDVPKVPSVEHETRGRRGHKVDSIQVLQKRQRYKKQGKNAAKLKTSKAVTLAVVEEHHEGKYTPTRLLKAAFHMCVFLNYKSTQT